MAVDESFWSGRRVLVTGHTGFKGAWLTLWLGEMGAEVTGFADGVPTTPSLFELAGLREMLPTVWGDVRDYDAVLGAIRESSPEVVIHMAAQPFVRRSFSQPRETYETNVMGTVNVLEAVRLTPGVSVVINVTSDKCYENLEHGRPFREQDAKGGHDPYSNSKGCAELVADAYRCSFFSSDQSPTQLASGRAGNVIGGGDWGEDRLIPDIMRGALVGETVKIRNPDSVRPWQHVLNPLSGYLKLVEMLWHQPGTSLGWNFGPEAEDALTVGEIAERVGDLWPGDLSFEIDDGPHPHEATLLRLDSSKAHTELGWAPTWNLEQGLEATVAWYAALRDGRDMAEVSVEQIRAFGDGS
ncbi:MAG: CDP-glucose 4,6-dehydratase [Solirubrobacterales bacterium]|nr:CDP-glucose 4,6-dehydratase [Solirubrobacterales bacterium]